MTGSNDLGSAKFRVEADIHQVKPALEEVKNQIGAAGEAADNAGKKIDTAAKNATESVKQTARELMAAAGTTKSFVSEAEDELQSIGNTAQSVGRKIDNTFEKLGTRLEDSTKGARKFSGALSGIAGAVTGFIGVATLAIGVLYKMAKGMEEAEEKSKRAGDALYELQKATEELSGAEKTQLELARERRRELRAEYAANKDLTEQERLRALNSIDDALYKRELLEIEKERLKTEERRLRGAEAGERIRQNRIASEQQLKDLADQLATSLLPPEDQIQAQTDDLIKIINDTARRAGSSDSFLVEAAIKAAEESERRQLQAIKDAAAEKERLDAERIAKNEQREREAQDRLFKRAEQQQKQLIAQLTAGLDGAFGVNSQFTSRLDSIVTDVKLILAATESRPK